MAHTLHGFNINSLKKPKMEKNQNDKRNQQSDSKSNRQSTQVGKKKEIDPNNPTANRNKEKGGKQVDQQAHGSTSIKGKKNMDVKQTESKESKTGNRNSKNGNF